MHYNRENCFGEMCILGRIAYKYVKLEEMQLKMLIHFHENLLLKKKTNLMQITEFKARKKNGRKLKMIDFSITTHNIHLHLMIKCICECHSDIRCFLFFATKSGSQA